MQFVPLAFLATAVAVARILWFVAPNKLAKYTGRKVLPLVPSRKTLTCVHHPVTPGGHAQLQVRPVSAATPPKTVCESTAFWMIFSVIPFAAGLASPGSSIA